MKTSIRERPTETGSTAFVVPEGVMAMVLDRTTDGVLLADAHGTIVYVNRPLVELFGYEATDLLGRPVEILLPEDLRDSHRDSVEGFVHSPKPRPMGRDDLDIEGRHADGSHFPVDVQLDAVPGTPFVAATVRDMTAQRHAAAEFALDRIDLANSRAEADRLRESLDLVIQRLFALGMSIAAGASNEDLLADRMATALHGIDEIIEAVQTGRRAVGP
ncbi:MAG: PAS domain S-box protein [Ilumatobacteraceae bacterium]